MLDSKVYSIEYEKLELDGWNAPQTMAGSEEEMHQPSTEFGEALFCLREKILEPISSNL